MFSAQAIRSPQENTQLFENGKSFVYTLQLPPCLLVGSENKSMVDAHKGFCFGLCYSKCGLQLSSPAIRPYCSIKGST